MDLRRKIGPQSRFEHLKGGSTQPSTRSRDHHLEIRVTKLGADPGREGQEF